MTLGALGAQSRGLCVRKDKAKMKSFGPCVIDIQRLYQPLTILPNYDKLPMVLKTPSKRQCRNWFTKLPVSSSFGCRRRAICYGRVSASYTIPATGKLRAVTFWTVLSTRLPSQKGRIQRNQKEACYGAIFPY